MDLPEQIKQYFQDKGREGGRKTNANRTPEERKAIGRKGALIRWKNHKRTGKRKKSPK